MAFRAQLLTGMPTADADIIVTAAVLGFSAGLLEAGKPVRFDVDGEASDDDWRQLVAAVEKTNRVLGLYANAAAKVVAGHAPVWTNGSVITGAKGKDGIEFDERHMKAFAAAGPQMAAIVTDVSQGGYQGRGAYTGFTYNPDTQTATMMSTYRALVPDEFALDVERWYPADCVGRPADSPGVRYPWGLIGATKPSKDDVRAAIANGGLSLSRDPLRAIKQSATDPYEQGGMGPMPVGWDSGEKIIGYTHGMIQAIVNTEARGGAMIPFEVAVCNERKETTKLASCFPCTMYMYAAGYPPSAIHLGRGESWVPFYPERRGQHAAANVVNTTADRINTAWYGQCAEHLKSGAKILGQAGVSNAHTESLSAFQLWISTASDRHPAACANLILDALTVHVSESVRVERTLR